MSMEYPVFIPVTLTMVSINRTLCVELPLLSSIVVVDPSWVNKKVLVFKSKEAPILNSMMVPLGPAIVCDELLVVSLLMDTIPEKLSTV